MYVRMYMYVYWGFGVRLGLPQHVRIRVEAHPLSVLDNVCAHMCWMSDQRHTLMCGGENAISCTLELMMVTGHVHNHCFSLISSTCIYVQQKQRVVLSKIQL